MTELGVAVVGAAASILAAGFSMWGAHQTAKLAGRATEAAAEITSKGTEAAADISRKGTEAAAEIDRLASVTAAGIEAAGAQVAATVAANAEIATSDKSIFVDSITSERAIWRTELRTATVNVTTALRASAKRLKVDWSTVLQGCTEITLRLNPVTRAELQPGDQKHAKDRAVYVAVDAVLATTPRDRGAHEGLAAELEKAVQSLLKQEWQVSKNEARSGLLA